MSDGSIARDGNGPYDQDGEGHGGWRERMRAEMMANLAEVVLGDAWDGYSGRFCNAVERLIEGLTGMRALLTNSGTSALECVMRGMAVEEGAEIIVPCCAPHASLQAVLRAGATPVLCRVADDTLTIDAADLDRRRSGRTMGVMYVYAFGNPTGVVEAAGWCASNGVPLIEDAAGAFDASIMGRAIGGWGRAAILSFNHAKRLTCGEGGAVVTGDPALHDAVRELRHGGYRRGDRGYHEAVSVGGKMLLSELQAAALLPQLQRARSLAADVAERAARIRFDLRERAGLHVQHVAPDAEHAWNRVAAIAPEGEDILRAADGRYGLRRMWHRPIVDEPVFAARAVVADDVAEQVRELWRRVGICDPALDRSV